MPSVLWEAGEVFVLLFAVMNVLPVLPVVLSLTEDLPEQGRRRSLRAAIMTVAVTGLCVTVLGGPSLQALGMTLPDLRIAGGIILLVFAVHDLLFARLERKEHAQSTDAAMMLEEDDDGIGVVPLGVPIVLGPGGMATLLVFAETRGLVPVLLAFAGNLMINAFILYHSDAVRRRVGRPLIRGLGKVMGVLLAALGVSMIRTGVVALSS